MGGPPAGGMIYVIPVSVDTVAAGRRTRFGPDRSVMVRQALQLDIVTA
jgi:hypothetical protein